MTIDSSVVPGLLLIAAQLGALAAFGFVIARVLLRQSDDCMALAQGLVVGPALWGLGVNFLLHLFPGRFGMLAGWAIALAVGVGLVWRARDTLRISPRAAAGVAVAALAIFWVALATRQMLGDPDPIHLGIAASVRQGGWPPVIPWSPDQPAPYHYGIDLLIGMLSPPFGPDPAFTTELVGAYAWTGLVMALGAALLRGASWLGALALTPLLVTAGAWTLYSFDQPPNIVSVFLPTGIPQAGIGDSLTAIYWPSVEFPWTSVVEASPANILNPSFTFAYALAFVALERITASQTPTWPAAVTVAVLIGFLGLVDETVALIVLGLWFLLAVASLAQTPVARRRADSLRAATGLALAALLLAVGGGVLTGILTGATGGELSLAWPDDPGSRQPIGLITQMAGGVGVLGLNVLPVALAAAALASRSRLTLALAVGSIVLLLAALTLRYEFAEHDVVRLDGHARNLALMALLVALGIRLSALNLRWRYVAGALIVSLVVWPTAVAPMHNIARALGRGPQLANAQIAARASPEQLIGRFVFEHFRSQRVAAYLRDHAAADARVLTPHPTAMTLATGRPNASGFLSFLHLGPAAGPEYLDAIHYLEPAALRRLEVAYVHATEEWVAALPEPARRWLRTPELFEPLLRDGADSLFRVRPAFLRLDSKPEPRSFEALRQVVPATATVYLSTSASPLDALRVAATLSHARLLGMTPTANLHPLTGLDTEQLGTTTPDLVVAPTMSLPGDRAPIWWRGGVGVYATQGAVAPLMPPPVSPRTGVEISDARAADGRLAFAATFRNSASELWTSQDWLVVAADASTWESLHDLEHGEAPQWYAGQIMPGPGIFRFTYEFDARKGSLNVRDGESLTPAPSSARELGLGAWLLEMRLRDGQGRVHLFPLFRIVIAGDGAIAYELAGESLRTSPEP